MPAVDRPSPVRRLLSPLRRFLEVESAGGAVLLVCTAIALAFANSPLAAQYAAIWDTPLVIGIGARFVLNDPIQFWINDGLMTIFFFVVGLEIKRELIGGELRTWRLAALPVVAALGGMIVPAAVYFALAPAGPASRGWGIPMATDIAFVVGALALFGRRVPPGLKIFLLALAIVDDIGAVLVIAFVYTHQLSLAWLSGGMAGLAALYLLTRLGARSAGVYVVMGVLVWLAFLLAGVHPTVAGVAIGFLVPARPCMSLDRFRAVVNDSVSRLIDDDDEFSSRQRAIFGEITWAAKETISPLERWQHALHPAVSFLIMPVFALANAGVAIDSDGLVHPVALAVAAGLIVGKPLGILAASWLAIRFGIARLPAGVDWRTLGGAACLGGIGFTMSIFIAGLALPPQLLAAGKVGTLVGSLVSAAVGATLLLCFLPRLPAKLSPPT